MLGDSQSVLYTVLAISIALLTIFLCVALIYLILILRDSSKMLDRVKQTVERVNSFIIKPIDIASSIIEHVRPLIESVLEKRVLGPSRRKKK